MKAKRYCKETDHRLSGILATCVLGASLAFGTAAPAESVDRLMGVVEPIVATKPLTLGAALVHLQDEYWKGMAYGISDEAKRSGVEVSQISIAGGYGNVPQQFSQIETLISRGIDTLILAPTAYNGFDPVLKRLKNDGVNVLVAGVPVNSDMADFGIVQSDAEVGRALLDAVCEHKGDKSAKALVIQGPAGAEWARLRVDAIQESAADCNGLELVMGPIGKEISLAYGVSQANDMLLTHPDAAYVITIESVLGLGATQAVKATGSSAKVVTSAIDHRVAEEIVDGEILIAAVSEPGVLIGRLLVQYAIRLNEGVELSGLDQLAGFNYPVVIAPAELFSRETVSQHPLDLFDIPPEDWSLGAIQ